MTMQKPILVAILLTLLLPADSFSQLVPPPRIAPAGAPLFLVKVNGKEGFIDANGKIVIEPAFEEAYPFTEGLAAVQKQGAWGFIDTTGRVVIEPQFVTVGFFSGGLATFSDKQRPDKKGYIDKTGKVVIKPQFDVAEGFRNGVARVGFFTLKGRLLNQIADVGLECDYKFIDQRGKIVPEPSPLHYATGEAGELIPFMKNDRAGYLNAKGEVVIQPQFHAAFAFSEGLARVSKDGLCGFINKSGEWVIPPRFEYGNEFSEELAGVSLGEEGWGFIDHSGKVVIPGKFAWVYGGFRHGVAEVAFDRKLGYINKKGEWVWPPSE
jgi:hypothetical protein